MIRSRAERSALAELVQSLPDARLDSSGRAPLELSLSGADPPVTKHSRVIEDDTMRAHDVRGEPARRVSAFLDGVQRSEVCAWCGPVPLVYAHVRAVIRARVGRRLVTWGEGPLARSALYVPPQVSLNALPALGVVTLDPEPEPRDGHPHLAIRQAYRRVQADREAVERQLAERFVRQSDEVLYVDGGLPNSRPVLAQGSALGVIKSHHTLYVTGDALRAVLALAGGERSSVFEVGTHWGRDAVASWYLRLHGPAGRDPFWGLVRVEIPMRRLAPDARAAANDVSLMVLAERAPLALPDKRWDTMAYGIHDCEEYLTASLPVGR
jgi:hypothetical protein